MEEEWGKNESKLEGTDLCTWPGLRTAQEASGCWIPAWKRVSWEKGWDQRVLLPPCGMGEDYSYGGSQLRCAQTPTREAGQALSELTARRE